MNAAGPWTEPTEVPDDPKRYCLVDVSNVRNAERKLFLVKYVLERWVFPDRSWLSSDWTVLRWAYVNEQDQVG